MNQPTDHTTTVAELREVVRLFVEERDWQPFHTPKNLAMALAIEAAELMEHFQWLTPEASQGVVTDKAQLAEVSDELADVLCYTLAMANALNIDVAQALQEKMVKNRRKYPIEEYRGRFGPNDPNPVSDET